MKPSPELFSKIVQRIRQKEHRLQVRRSMVALVLALLSSVSLVIAFGELFSAFETSGFFAYASLVFSNVRETLHVWPSMIFALLESLPIVSMTVVLFTLLLTLLTFHQLNRQTRFLLVHF